MGPVHVGFAMRAWVHAGVAALLGSLFVLALEIPGLDTFTIVVASDSGQLLAVSAAAVLCWLASRAPGSHTRAWRALAVGVGAWAAGQTVWTYYEVVAGTEVPFPSLADLGFLTFPIVAGFGLLTWLGTQGHARIAARGRDVLDGAVIVLLAVAWARWPSRTVPTSTSCPWVSTTPPTSSAAAGSSASSSSAPRHSWSAPGHGQHVRTSLPTDRRGR